MGKIYNNDSNNMGFVFKTIGRCFSVTIILLFLNVFTASSQEHKNSITAPDSSFTMKVSREKGEILIVLKFAPNFKFDYVAVERKSDADQSYSQCKYIDYDEVVKKERHIVKKDNYPYPGSSDVLYRLKVVAKDGSERTYSPILLPAVGH